MRITDPQRIRALTHPLRLELMDVLAEEGAATATRCAELTGESVASCSFHLRMLAKYGYIEPAERTGREKPWRLRLPLPRPPPRRRRPGVGARRRGDGRAVHRARGRAHPLGTGEVAG